MTVSLSALRPVSVAGIGLDRYSRASERPYEEIGLHAVRDALEDARLEWRAAESAYVATTQLGMGAGTPMLRHLGATGVAITQVENASASGSSAIRLACMEIASGLADVALAVGVDKVGNRWAASKGGAPLVGRYLKPAVHYALLASEYLEQHDVAPETLAMVAVKNSRNGSLNPYAQRQRARTLEDVLGAPVIAGHLTSLQCCPVGEGAAAAVLVADDAIESLGLDAARCIPVVASESRSEALYDGRSFDAELTATTAQAALAEAGITAEDLDVVEFHDAFSIEELQYAEAIGLAPAGKAGVALHGGEFDIGGRCAISPSGGLLSMGHPLGPTGVGQVAEIVRQLRGEAGARQQPNARYGLAHMVGLGAVCVVHVLRTRASAPSG